MKVAKAKTIVLILGDQLSHQISSLKGFDPREDLVLMVEVADETTYVRHHKQKIAFILSAMRHFADELCELGFAMMAVIRYRANDMAHQKRPKMPTIRI